MASSDKISGDLNCRDIPIAGLKTKLGDGTDKETFKNHKTAPIRIASNKPGIPCAPMKGIKIGDSECDERAAGKRAGLDAQIARTFPQAPSDSRGGPAAGGRQPQRRRQRTNRTDPAQEEIGAAAVFLQALLTAHEPGIVPRVPDQPDLGVPAPTDARGRGIPIQNGNF